MNDAIERCAKALYLSAKEGRSRMDKDPWGALSEDAKDHWREMAQVAYESFNSLTALDMSAIRPEER